MRNVDGSLNKKRSIEYMVEVDIYYQKYRKRTEIDVIGGQKWSVILGMLQLAHHNPKIDWRTEGKDDEMSREVWKVVEAKAGKTRIAKTKRREEEERKEKEAKEEEVEEERKEKEETKKAENNKSKKSGRKIGDLG